MLNVLQLLAVATIWILKISLPKLYHFIYDVKKLIALQKASWPLEPLRWTCGQGNCVPVTPPVECLISTSVGYKEINSLLHFKARYKTSVDVSAVKCVCFNRV